MTELVKATGNALSSKIEYAQAMAGSNLLPQSYRNNPANLLFALEYAEALQVSPIHAITSIHVISGRPSASADLIAATVRRAGHKLRVTGDDSRAVAQLIRADDPDFTYEAVWDLEKAKRAGLNTQTWKAYPGAMLRARAITEVARAGASDALFGVIYTPEELGAQVDADGAPVAAPEPVATRPMSRTKPAPEPVAELEPEPLEQVVAVDNLVGEVTYWAGSIEQHGGDVAALRALYNDAVKAGAPTEVLDMINAAGKAAA